MKGGADMNSSLMKSLIIAAVIAYIVSPVDLAPGPVDDLIVLLLGVAARKKLISSDDQNE